MIALDTNLLVYALRPGVAEHRPAQRALERACATQVGCGISMPTIAEFWSIATHHGAPGGASSPADASRFLHAFITGGGVRVWAPPEGFDARLTAVAADLSVRGPRIFDLQIALIAFDNGARELWTHDAGFTTLPGLRLHDPLRARSS